MWQVWELAVAKCQQVNGPLNDHHYVNLGPQRCYYRHMHNVHTLRANGENEDLNNLVTR